MNDEPDHPGQPALTQHVILKYRPGPQVAIFKKQFNVHTCTVNVQSVF